MRILVLNAGSSTLKAALFDGDKRIWSGHAEWGPGPVEDAVHRMLRDVPDPSAIDMAGHRIVHGGPRFEATAEITPEVQAAIAQNAEFAPEHNRIELAVIAACQGALGSRVRQFAVFDTAFHATMPLEAQVYAGPWDWYGDGIRRYGFHGISHRYAARKAAEMLGPGLRLVTCHLGSGASLAAVKDGRSIDTTMGFTPLDGLVMGTRSGSVDPGILIYLLRHRAFDADRLDRVLNEESGLKGLAGTADMRAVLAARARGEERAKIAFDVYVHRLCRDIGGMAAALGGVDALVFTGGVGENSEEVRTAANDRLRFLEARVLVVKADEEGEIARELSSFGSVSKSV